MDSTPHNLEATRLDAAPVATEPVTTEPAAGLSSQCPPDPAQERWESLKVGLVSGAIGFAGEAVAPWGASGFNLLINLAIAAVSGFLFGPTYRYIVRHDNNAHLRSGAVGAFGLVRGLALLQGETGPLLRLWSQQHWAELALTVGGTLGQSLGTFLVSRWLIDWGSDRGWLQRFPMAIVNINAKVTAKD
jgi:hypothetical protein